MLDGGGLGAVLVSEKAVRSQGAVSVWSGAGGNRHCREMPGPVCGLGSFPGRTHAHRSEGGVGSGEVAAGDSPAQADVSLSGVSGEVQREKAQMRELGS